MAELVYAYVSEAYGAILGSSSLPVPTEYMIEIEKKFVPDDASKKALLDGAEFIGKKTFVDLYYDLPTWDLTCKDNWLRRRDGRWELKVALADFSKRAVDQYRELETEGEIADFLSLPKTVPLEKVLTKMGYVVVADITTTRTKYRKDGFVIDVDLMNFGYEIVEIEKMVNAKESIEVASAEILAFASRFGLSAGKVRGKVLEYIKRNSPKHFGALVAAGICI